MRYSVDPQQTTLFDGWERVISPSMKANLIGGWQGVFREAILLLMPVEHVGKAFHPTMGRPTKELYSLCGLILLMEMNDWSLEETLNNYRFRMDVHFALNLEPVAQRLGARTLERYVKLLCKDEVAAEIMEQVTRRVVELAEVKLDRQRLDSTHVFSNMATFGRTRLMGVTIRRFLTQVKRHDPAGYAALDEELRARYAQSEHRLFGSTGKDEESRRQLRQQVAQDMWLLIQRFEADAAHAGRSSFKRMKAIFQQQCEVVESGAIEVRKATGGNIIQNPSDADATYDGKKGPGYQVQIAETCHSDNEVQLITCALAQTAVEADAKAAPVVFEQLAKSQRLPVELFADAAYGSDENVEQAAAMGVELISPTKEGASEQAKTDPFASLSLDDFVIDEATEAVVRCPNGITPESSMHEESTGKTTTIMPAAACAACAFADECPVRKTSTGYRLEHSGKQRRLAGRRREERTAVFAERYAIRAGIESTNSGLKRRTGLGRLRVRGRPRVEMSILLKLAGWNILRAAASGKVRAKVAEMARKRAKARLFALFFCLTRHFGHSRQLYSRILRFSVCVPAIAPAFRAA
jgi:hypothetical protein